MNILHLLDNTNNERERIELVLRNHSQHSNPYLTLSDPIQTASINQMINCLCEVKEVPEGFDSDYCYKCGKLKGFLAVFRFSLRSASFQLKIIRTMWDGHKAFILNFFPDRVRHESLSVFERENRILHIMLSELNSIDDPLSEQYKMLMHQIRVK